MTAHEQQHECIIALTFHGLGKYVRGCFMRGNRLFTTVPRSVAARTIEQAPVRNAKQPSTRIRRNAGNRPLLGRINHCILHCVFGDIEITSALQQRAEGVRRKLTQHTFDNRQ